MAHVTTTQTLPAAVRAAGYRLISNFVGGPRVVMGSQTIDFSSLSLAHADALVRLGILTHIPVSVKPPKSEADTQSDE